MKAKRDAALLREAINRSHDRITRTETGETHRFYAFRPWDTMPGMVRFMESECDTQVAATANRCSKTYSGGRKVAAYAIGHDPLYPSKKFLNPKDRPFTIWAGIPPEFPRDALNEMRRWIPPQFVQDVRRSPGDMEIVLRPSKERPHGAIIKFKTYGMRLEEWQREIVDVMWLDELAPLYVWEEIQQRLLLSRDPSIGWRGKLIMTLTNVTGAEWVFAKCHDFKKEYQNLLTGPFGWYTGSQFENPLLDPEDIEARAAGLSPEMYKIRVLGVPTRISGTEIFPPSLCRALAERCRDTKPKYRVRFSLDGKPQVDPYSEGEYGWTVWEQPVPGEHYSIGADPSNGTGNDYASADVIARGTGRVVAQFHDSHVEPVDFGHELLLAGHWYNTALVVPETNIASVLYALRRGAYPRIYQRQTFGGRVEELQDAYGWWMDRRSKDAMVGQLRRALQNGIDGKRGGIILPSSETVEELQLFGYLKEKRPGSHGTGCLDSTRHDDRVISLGLAVMGLEQLPQNYIAERTAEEMFKSWFQRAVEDAVGKGSEKDYLNRSKPRGTLLIDEARFEDMI